MLNIIKFIYSPTKLPQENHSILTLILRYGIVKMESEPPKKSNVLVLGSAGVGKTSFIRALKEYIADKPQTFSELDYTPTRSMFIEHIPATNTDKLDKSSVLNNCENGKYCKPIAKFIVDRHHHKEERFFLLERHDMLYGNIPEDKDVGEITMCELSPNCQDIPDGFHSEFDKIVIMCNYHDIGSIRSVQYWAELINAPTGKIIVCVNMCDAPPKNYDNDFQDRKAQLLRHYSEQCKLEFISVKTGANLGFLYKYAK